jgi:ABC-type molybdate transport system permease subunit
MLNEMKSTSGGKRFLYWTPRILSILMACFISIFALDVFEEGKTAWEMALAFFIHLIPSFVAVAIIIVAWKRELIGGWLFVALGIGFLFIGRFELVAMLMITLPLVIVGVLFLAYYFKYVKAVKQPTSPKVI